MMPNQINSHTKPRLFAFAVLLFTLFYSAMTYAEIPTLDQVIQRISDNIGSLMQMVTGGAYIIGTYFVIRGVMELKHFGESRTMMSSEHSLKKPLLFIFAGAALIYLPSSINAGLETLWQAPNP